MFQIRFASIVASVVAFGRQSSASATLVTSMLASFTPTLAQVQPPEVEWQYTYGGAGRDLGYSVQQTTDGGYIVAGETSSFDGGDVYLVKTDAEGNLLWEKTFGGQAGNSVQQTLDGGYIVAGYAAGGANEVNLVKTNSQGNLVWEKTYGGRGHDSGLSVQQTLDGGYIVAGRAESFGEWDVYLIKTNSQGILVWEKTFGGIKDDWGNSVQQTLNGGYIVAGWTESFGAGGRDVYLIKTNSQGILVWEKTFGGANWDEGSSIQQIGDGGYIVAGWTSSFDGSDVYLVKTDAEGNLLWEKTIGKAENGYAGSVQQTLDGGYIVAGYTSLFGGGSSEVYLVKTDAEGNLLWEKIIGEVNSFSAGLSVQQTTDGGYVVAGYTTSFGAGGSDVYLIKLKPDQPLPPKPCTPDAEVYDEMQTELSHNIEVFGLGRVCTADLTGTIGVKRYLPYVDPATGLRTIATKITKLELSGTDPACGEIKISLNPNIASGGKVVEQKAGTCFPADSYFDVYIQVAIPDQKLLANCKPATMRCTVSALPPIGCVYQIGTGFDVLLYDAASLDCTSPGNSLANIVAADHKPTVAEGPPRVIPQPTRRQLHLFRDQQWVPLTDEVRADFNPTLPVIIIVHGFNFALDPAIPSWTTEIARAFASRKLTPYVNILTWDWQLEAQGGDNLLDAGRFARAASLVHDQSRRLARALTDLFRARGFTPPIHLMGHSLGAALVAFTAINLQDRAVSTVSYAVANVTLWDPPDRSPAVNLPIETSLTSTVPYLREKFSTIVDCYRSELNARSYFANVWYASAGPGHGASYAWYQNRVLPASEPTLHRSVTCDETALLSTIGFGASQIHTPPDRQLRLDVCQPAERDVSLVAHSAHRDCNNPDEFNEFVYAQYCIANAGTTTPLITHRLDLGIGNDACACEVPPDLDPEREGTRVRMRLRRPGQGGGGGQEKNLTATYTLPLTVAPEWDYIGFTYRIEAAPAPATVTLSIQDGESVVPLWLATSDTDLGELADSTLLNITPYHGKEVSLIFSLASDQPDAIVEVSNLTLAQGPFHDNVAPVSNAGADRAVAVADPLATVVSLDGSGTTDANGDPLVYVWTATQDPAVAEQEGIIAVGGNPTVELPLGGYQFTLHARDPFDGFSSADVIVEVEYPFIRGDSNADGQVNIADAIATLNWLFNDTKQLCRDAADTKNDGVVDISDPIALLNYLFLGTAEAPKPPTFPNVGLDPTPDLLGCDLKQP